MAGERGLIRLALFGSPIARSLSPRIHQAFAAQAGLQVDYRAIECLEPDLESGLRRFAAGGGLGCNITLPLKHTACRLATRLSDRANRAAAVNTMRLEEGASWYGDNTDGPGLVRDLLENLGLRVAGARIAVLGAGGAAAGILFDLLSQRPERLAIANRDARRGQRLADRFTDLGPVEAFADSAFATQGPFDLVINATSAGHAGALPQLSPELFQPASTCYDLNYGAAHAGLAAWCAAHAVRCHGGLGMLVEQAAESFRLWTGFRPRTGPVIRELSQ